MINCFFLAYNNFYLKYGNKFVFSIGASITISIYYSFLNFIVEHSFRLEEFKKSLYDFVNSMCYNFFKKVETINF